MKEISSLVPDIYRLIQDKSGWFHDQLAQQLSIDISHRLRDQFNASPDKPALRLSQMGPRCPRALWHSIHTPERAEPLPPWAEIKYSFGHVLEALAVSLAKAAEHEVTGEQDELVLDGIVGHRDCVIDGCVVDVKSCSSRQFDKYKSKTISMDDSFGYLDQLDGYVVASALDPLVRIHDRGYILAIDKTLGHLALYEHIIREQSIRQRIEYYKKVVGLNSPPMCECGTIELGQSGNICLDTRASYSAYKFCCKPSIRVAIYSDGPKYFTKVIKWPANQNGPLPEVDRYGKVLYN